jgi:hypothetical protein
MLYGPCYVCRVAISQRECTTCYPFLTSPRISAVNPFSNAGTTVFETPNQASGPDSAPGAATSPERSEVQEDIVDRIAGFFDMVLKPCGEFPCQNCKQSVEYSLVCVCCVVSCCDLWYCM